MKPMKWTPVALGLASALAVSNCKTSDPDALLVVEPAQQQPRRDDLGIIVIVQSFGGKWLEVEIEGGTLSGNEVGTCIPAPQNKPLSESLTTLVVFPTQVEAVITVRLLPDGPRIARADNGADASADAAYESTGPCRIAGVPLREVTKPVARDFVSQTPASGGTSSAGGASSVPPAAGGSTSMVSSTPLGGASVAGGAGSTGLSGTGGATNAPSTLEDAAAGGGA